MKTILCVSAALLISGCAPHKPLEVMVADPIHTSPIHTAPVGVTPKAENASVTRIQECKKELTALKVFNPRSYEKYQAEFDSISRETQKYITVQGQLSDDINFLVMPKYQFAVRNVCFRIKHDLSISIISQVK